MYYQNYDDYMRSVLGYSIDNDSLNTYNNDFNYDAPMYNEIEIEENPEWYPEIYRIVYPMVCKSCEEKRSAQVSSNLIENITDTIYTNIEVTEQGETPKQELRNGDVPNPRVKQQEQKQTRHVGPRNPLLRDLIKILVIRELFDRRKPSRPNRPPRPPFPGGPGMPPPPPPMPRYY